MIQEFTSILKKFGDVHDMAGVDRFLTRGVTRLTGLNGSSKAFFIASFFKKAKGGLLLVVDYVGTDPHFLIPAEIYIHVYL